MVPIIPEGECGDYRIEHLPKNWDGVVRDAVETRFSWMMRFSRTDTYCILWDKKEIIMSDTDLERVTNEVVLQDAYGDVLIAGLGIGMLPYHLCKLDKVKSVTVLEIQSKVITLVYPHIRHPKLQVILANAEVPPFPDNKPPFNYAYIDIWSTAGVEWDVLKQYLIDFSLYVPDGGCVDAWLREYTFILDNGGIKNLPDMYRPLSGWYYHDDGAEEQVDPMLRAIFETNFLAKRGGK